MLAPRRDRPAVVERVLVLAAPAEGLVVGETEVDEQTGPRTVPPPFGQHPQVDDLAADLRLALGDEAGRDRHIGADDSVLFVCGDHRVHEPRRIVAELPLPVGQRARREDRVVTCEQTRLVAGSVRADRDGVGHRRKRDRQRARPSYFDLVRSCHWRSRSRACRGDRSSTSSFRSSSTTGSIGGANSSFWRGPGRR